MLDRVGIASGTVCVIAPTRQIAAGVPIDAGVEWLALEDPFRLSGEVISFLGAPWGLRRAAHERSDCTRTRAVFERRQMRWRRTGPDSGAFAARMAPAEPREIPRRHGIPGNKKPAARAGF